MWLFCYLNFERNYDVLKARNRCILLNKNINFNKNETESKIENPHKTSERRALSFSSNKNLKLKVKLWWIGARERKKRAFFVPFILSKRHFFNICILSQCSVLNTRSEYTCFYISKNITSYTFLLVFKVSKSLQCILKQVGNLMPLLPWIAKTEFSEVLTKLSNAFLNDIGEGNDFMSSLKLFHSREQCGKNVLLMLTAIEAIYFTIFFV